MATGEWTTLIMDENGLFISQEIVDIVFGFLLVQLVGLVAWMMRQSGDVKELKNGQINLNSKMDSIHNEYNMSQMKQDQKIEKLDTAMTGIEVKLTEMNVHQQNIVKNMDTQSQMWQELLHSVREIRDVRLKVRD